jgi:hypothetical protein
LSSYQLGTSLQDGERPSLENLPTLSSLHLQQLKVFITNFNKFLYHDALLIKMEQVILSFNERITDLEEDLAMLEDLAYILFNSFLHTYSLLFKRPFKKLLILAFVVD